MTTPTPTAKVVTQTMIDNYFQYDVKASDATTGNVLSAVFKSDIKLSDALVGQAPNQERDCIGTKLVIRNNSLGSTPITTWAKEATVGQTQTQLLLIEVVVLSATVEKYIKLKERKETAVNNVLDPSQLTVVIDPKENEVDATPADETGDTTNEKKFFVIREDLLTALLEKDCTLRTQSLSRVQSESEGMTVQITQAQLLGGDNPADTDVLSRIYFVLSPSVTDDVRVVNLEIGVRAIRGVPPASN